MGLLSAPEEVDAPPVGVEGCWSTVLYDELAVSVSNGGVTLYLVPSTNNSGSENPRPRDDLLRTGLGGSPPRTIAEISASWESEIPPILVVAEDSGDFALAVMSRRED